MMSDIMTSRTQITLEPHLQQLARQRARAKGISFAEYVSRLIRTDVGTEAPRADVSTIFGIADSGGTDIARDKHKLIGEAFAAIKLDRRK
jgi:hypothetical protein